MVLEAEDGFEVVAEAGDLEATRRYVRAHRPRVLVLDLNLPEGSSLPAIPELREQSPDTAVVVLTMQQDPAFAREAMRAGALGYVLKHSAGTELVDAVRAAAAGDTYLNPKLGRPARRRAAGARGPTRRAHRARGRDPAADRSRPHELRDRRAALPQRADRRVAPRAHPAEDGPSTRAELVRYALDHGSDRVGPRMDVRRYSLLAGSGTALATGLGALPVSRLGDHATTLRPALWGMTVGLMTVASVVGSAAPGAGRGFETEPWPPGLRSGSHSCSPPGGCCEQRDVHVGQLSGAGVRRSVLVFAVLLVHSLPEGFAIGTAYASETEGLGLFVILAIALQNVPEGTSVAIPMEAAGFPPRSSSGLRC